MKSSSDMRALLWNCYSTERHKLSSLSLDPAGEYLSQFDDLPPGAATAGSAAAAHQNSDWQEFINTDH